MTKANNLWQLLQKTHDRVALMRACGVLEGVLTDGSDFDKFAAYAACMPLCQGHWILKADVQLIGELLGVSVPICPESAASLWHAAAYALCAQGERPDPTVPCDVCFVAPTQETVLGVDLGESFFATPTVELMMRLLDPEVQAIGVTVQIQSFVKPNPYTAKRLYEADKDTLTDAERDHLSAQTLRVLGKLCSERALLAYLQQSGCIAQFVLTLRDENALRAAASLAGFLPNPTDAPAVRVGIANVPDREALLDLYATLLPIGVLPPIDQKGQ